MALTSMTGFADRAGRTDGFAWTWEARSVNGRGLDLRLRLPDALESLDVLLRAAAGRALVRGSVTVTLRLTRGDRAAAARLNAEALEGAIAAALAASETASRLGLDLAPMTAADLITVRGVLEVEGVAPEDTEALLSALGAEIEPLFAALAAARAAEGEALGGILGAQLGRIEALAQAARVSAEARAARSGALLRSRMEAVLLGTAAVDEVRLAQELALLAVRADVTEELDRLDAHVVAARVLIAGAGPAGRKLDFLMQEFNREANTLCSKAGSRELTAIGLEMKVVIDQMREQVQNVE